MSLLLAYLFLAIVVSFACSLMEAVILSVSPSYIKHQIKQGRRFALILQDFKDDIDRPLAAILTFNTIAHTVGAAGVGAQVARFYGDHFLTLASILLTFVILVFSEIIPKTLGASNWRAFAPVASYFIKLLILLVYPIVFLTEKISDRISGGQKSILTREEMIATAEIGVGEGSLKKKESNIIKNLLMLDRVPVGDIMTPRSVLMSLPVGMEVGEVVQLYKPMRYSRIPVYGENLDDIRGVVHRYQILDLSAGSQKNKKLSEIKIHLHRVFEDMSVASCLDSLIYRNEHIFLVVDGEGKTQGIVTLEDAIETLLGVEIVDELDSVADLRLYARTQRERRKFVKKV